MAVVLAVTDVEAVGAIYMGGGLFVVYSLSCVHESFTELDAPVVDHRTVENHRVIRSHQHKHTRTNRGESIRRFRHRDL